MYGITDTTVHVTYREIDAADASAGTASLIGKPIPDLSLHVLDDRQALLPVGVPGELYVGGAGLARGYLNRPQLDAERFIRDPFSDDPRARLYRTGDLVRRRSDGDIEYLGRIDNQVQVRGFRIELGEIEATLRRHAGVEQAVVVARAVADEAPRIVAYFVAATESTVDVEALRAHVRRELPDYMTPAAFVQIDRVPLTENGKVDYRALPDPVIRRGDGASAFVAPRTDIERKVAAIWCEVLGVDQVSVLDGFFDLGGHSLLGTRVAARLTDEFGIEFPLRTFFASPTVEAVAERVAELLVSRELVDTPETSTAREEFEL
jgi:acyl carrier protein